MAKQLLVAQNPLILRCNRLIEAFAKSDDERDFYLDRQEGFIIYVDLDKPNEELAILEKELEKNNSRYCLIPKLTFYETKKIMEGFINEKVYDIDTKEKLLDIIQSKEARENFLDFIYDHHSELEKWQSYYQERSRIRIIEWLRVNHFSFVFEEDLEFPQGLLERVKKELFETRIGKDILAARKTLVTKSKTYYSNEALNPRPKRGRPPKQAQKLEIEPQITNDIYTTVPSGLRGFLFTPDLNSPSSATFSSKFGNEEDLFSSRRLLTDTPIETETLTQKLAALRALSGKWKGANEEKNMANKKISSFDDDDEDDDEDDFVPKEPLKSAPKKPVKAPPKPAPKSIKKVPAKKPVKAPLKKLPPKKRPLIKLQPKTKPKSIISKPKAKTPPPKKKAAPPAKKKVAPPKKGKALRPMMKLKKKKTR